MNENRKTEFLTNIRQIMRLHDKMLKSICGQYQMNITETAVISFLYNNPGKDTAADIVALRMLANGGVPQAGERLIQKKLLEREQDTKDRRRIHLSLTPAANPITQEIEKAQKGFRDKVFQGFTEEERELFNEFHLRIQENTKQALEGGDIQ